MGSLSIGVLKRGHRARAAHADPAAPVGQRPHACMRHRQVEPLLELARGRVEAIDDRPFPVQVDGDYIGEFERVEFGVTPGGLLAVS